MVPDQFDAIPQRIGDAERDRAAEYLREHLAAGRLQPEEFEERISQALTARTGPELDSLFLDLPSPKPGDEVVPSRPYAGSPGQPGAHPVRTSATPLPAPARPNSAWGVLYALAWPVALIYCFATGFDNWWVLLIPMLFPWWIRRSGGHGHRRGR